MSGWYTSAMNYDMLSQNPWNTMNLHMNQLWDHNAAMQNMFNVPMYSFDNFMPYGNMGCNSYLTNPLFTLNQMSWGTPAWNNMPWNNGGNMNNMWSPWGWQGGNFNGGWGNGSSSSNSADTGTNRKYNRLHTLVKQLAKYDGLSGSEQDTLNDAIRDTKGTKEEQYERLLKAYNEIDKETVREFLKENGHNIGVSSEVNNSKDKNSFYHRLLNAGFEYVNTDIDDALSSIKEDISKWSGANGSALTAEGFVGYFPATYDILDFVSSWNSNYKGDSESSRIIDHIKKHYDKIDDKDQKESARSKLLVPLVEAMISRAQKVQEVLDKDSKDKIDEAIKELRESLENTKAEKNSKVDSDMSKAFDTLYLYTRQGAMVQLRNDAKAFYGEIDSAVFNDKLFKTDVVEDLKSEGFETDDIEGTEVKISKKEAKKASRSETDDGANNDAFKDIDKKAANEQVSILKAQGVITELTNVKKDDTITLYQENTMTGDSNGDGKADYAKIFYINDAGKLVEWKDAKLDNDKKLIDGIGESAVKASDIAKGKEEAEEAEEEKKKKESSVDSYDAKSAGKRVAQDLETATGEEESRRIAKNLDKEKLTKDNICDFLDGYYTKTNYDREGIIEFLDDDCEGDHVTIEMKKNIIESLMAKAKEMNLENEESYKSLNSIYNEWKSAYPDATDFNQTQSNEFFWINWFGGLWTNYNEALDEEIKKLFNVMKNK